VLTYAALAMLTRHRALALEEAGIPPGARVLIDVENPVHFCAACDDVINRGGELLYPREIEEMLIADPSVRDAVVVGRADPILGQVPVAYVIPANDPGTAEGLQHLLDVLGARCAAELSRFKRPEAIYVVEDLPRAATGKVRRYRLRTDAPAAAGIPAPVS